MIRPYRLFSALAALAFAAALPAGIYAQAMPTVTPPNVEPPDLMPKLMPLTKATPAPAATPAAISGDQAQAILAAEPTTLDWLKFIDNGSYEEAWLAASNYLHQHVTQSAWTAGFQSVRQPLGALVSRKLKEALLTRTLPGAPDGDYLVLQFDSSFAHKKAAVETITAIHEPDDTWKVAGYYFK